MSDNPLIDIQQYGQSIWLDDIRRRMILSGELERLIEEDGLRGVTSNPKIFDKAIAGSGDYDGAVGVLARQEKSVDEIYRAVTLADVQMTADLFRSTYESSGGSHGFVSLEVNPHLAYRTQETVEEARALWRALDRPNVFIKVPATAEGLPAIQQLVSEGINVNVTLLFGLPRYRKVAEAYIAGLEQRKAGKKPIDHVRSVASFFLSRIDSLVDPQLEKIAAGQGPEAQTASKLKGRIAVASAKQAYQIYRELFESDRFARLADAGAAKQRPLWASTSTKNPHYSDVKYVEALIGPETVNTLPKKTLDAYRDHGSPAGRLEEEVDQSREVLVQLGQTGIDIDGVTRQLEEEGVEKFNKPFDSLMKTLAEKRAEARKRAPAPQQIAWSAYGRSVQRRLDVFEEKNFVRRLQQKDVGLWAADKAGRRIVGKALGWLHAPERIEDTAGALLLFRREVKKAGFKQAVHMGMGGSSLAPLVFQKSFASGKEGIPLTVLDSTDPGAVSAAAEKAPLEDTLFVVASKSGTTTEAIAFMEYFYDRIQKVKGDGAGANFVAVTDPGTPLVAAAGRYGFRRLFVNDADVGGRFSALTRFGMVPAALMGLDIETLAARAMIMRRACRGGATIENPGLMLGAVLGELARQGRDKVTFVMPEAVSTLGMWLEQLLAESTGKQGTGLIPVAGEPLGEADVYGKDRVFVDYRLGGPEPEQKEKIAALKNAGHPVITIAMADAFDLAQEFYRWEIAVAAAGAVLGANVFDQPNVQESKDNTRAVLDEVQETGSLPQEAPDFEEDGVAVYGAAGAKDLRSALEKLLETAEEGDYCALLAYITEDRTNGAKLSEKLRKPLQQRMRLATTLGYGPRYLHSTGQLHKGGPGSGLYLMITAEAGGDGKVPGRSYSFGELRLAQAIGDFQALNQHGRRVLRFHVRADAAAGLDRIGQALTAGLDRLGKPKAEEAS